MPHCPHCGAAASFSTVHDCNAAVRTIFIVGVLVVPLLLLLWPWLVCFAVASLFTTKASRPQGPWSLCPTLPTVLDHLHTFPASTRASHTRQADHTCSSRSEAGVAASPLAESDRLSSTRDTVEFREALCALRDVYSTLRKRSAALWTTASCPATLK